MSSIKNFLKPGIRYFPLLCYELPHMKGYEETWISLIIGGSRERGCSHKPHTEHHLILYVPLKLFNIAQYFPECQNLSSM